METIAAAAAQAEKGRWKAHYKVEKYVEDIEPFRGRELDFYERHRPFEVVEGEGNLLLNEGINELWTLVAGGAGTAFSNANARIGVGDSSTAAAATQTDLQAATNKLYKAMEGGFPTYGTSQQIVFKASFATGEANWVWNEWSVDNGSGDGMNLNRKVENLGTKTTGTWALTVTITLS